MKKQILMISPHPDDAVFSLGAHILHLRRHSILVWNLFSIQSYSIHKNEQAHPEAEIITEDRNAATQLGFQILNENYREAGLRGYHKLSQIFNCTNAENTEKELFLDLKQSIHELLRTKAFDSVYLPLGCGGHIDHILARDAFLSWRNAHPQISFKLYLYEDLPYGTHPDWLQEGLEQMKKYRLRPNFLDITPYLEEKLYGIALYKSQIKQRDIEKIKEHSFDRHCHCPVERVWELKDYA